MNLARSSGLLLGGLLLFAISCPVRAELREITFTFDTESMGGGHIRDAATLEASSGNGTFTMIIDTDVADTDGDSGVGNSPDAIIAILISFADNDFSAEAPGASTLSIQLPLPLSTDNGISTASPGSAIVVYDNGNPVAGNLYVPLVDPHAALEAELRKQIRKLRKSCAPRRERGRRPW